MIIEGVITTFNRSTSKPNFAAMGVTVNENEGFDSAGNLMNFQIRPFEGSRTFANLKEQGEGVFHLLDDAVLLARAALSDASDTPVVKATKVAAPLICQAVNAFEFQVIAAEWSLPRSTLSCQVIQSHQLRNWRGWNRAQNAVLELTILATRLHLISENEIRSQIEQLRPLVEKTAGANEWDAWNFVNDYILKRWKEIS